MVEKEENNISKSQHENSKIKIKTYTRQQQQQQRSKNREKKKNISLHATRCTRISPKIDKIKKNECLRKITRN